MRVLALLGLSGCSSIFGLDTPSRHDAAVDDGRIDGMIDARFDATTVDSIPLCFTDNFDDNSIDSRWTVIASASPHQVREQGQRLEHVLAANVESYNGLKVNLAGNQHSLRVDMLQLPNGPKTEAYFGVVNDFNNQVLFIVSTASIYTRIRNGGVETPGGGIAFDTNTHRHWRIQIGGSPMTATLETSGNGVDFTVMQAGSINFAVGASYVGLVAGSFDQGNATPGVAIFDNFSMTSPICVPP